MFSLIRYCEAVGACRSAISNSHTYLNLNEYLIFETIMISEKIVKYIEFLKFLLILKQSKAAVEPRFLSFSTEALSESS